MEVADTGALLRLLRERLKYDPERGLLFRSQGYPGFVGGERVGSPQSGGKLQVCFLGVRYQVDRLIWLWETGALPVGPLVHVDGDPRNDRFGNLHPGRKPREKRPRKPRQRARKPPRVLKTAGEKRATKAAYIASHPELYAQANRRFRERLKRDAPERFQAERDRAKHYSKSWIKTPKGRVSARVQRQRRRARLAGAPGTGLTRAQWLAICANQTNEHGQVCCVYCKRACRPTIDHLVPLARGGLHQPSNIVAACGSCNSSKCDRLITEWERARKLLSEADLARLAGLTSKLLDADLAITST